MGAKQYDKSVEFDRRRASRAKYSLEMSAAGRDIGEIPEVEDIGRKNECRNNFRLFCETYFSNVFSLGWSEDHLKVISRIEECVLNGGLFALAMPRGSGKSSLCETAAVWAILYGHREFVCLIGANETASLEILSSIKTEFESNDLLYADFPEACYPIWKLEGINHRCAGQLYHGEKTSITWTSNKLILPTIPESKSSGNIITVAGITGRIRGMKHKRTDGRIVRPELVIIDDPQTRESASSLEQNRKRVATLSGDILGLAGPGKKISGIMPCTVIRPGDMADQILDRELHPDWNGEKMKLVYNMPSNTELWNQYAEIWKDSFRRKGNFSEATDFYVSHREEMDAGAVVAWEERHNSDEVSGIQYAMNLKLQDESSFLAEYQNEPVKNELSDDDLLSADEIALKLNGIPKTSYR